MKTLSEYVSWLNSMTTPELIKEFPGQFHTLNAKESSAECVKKMLANDAILWRMVKEYNQKLLSTEPVNSNNKPLVKAAVSVSVAVEEILQPKYMNDVYTWKQIQDAINKATER